MGFIYKKNKNNGDGFEWGTYSDLFANLSFVFLMLFAVAQLRMGTSMITSSAETQKLAKENQQLKQQIQVYETLKDQYVQEQASKEDVQVYDELMSQLDLLQDKANEEKKQLRQQASELEKKEKALNQYQQMVKSIVNANMLAQSKIKRRDGIISDNKVKIKNLESDLQEKQNNLQQMESQINITKAELENKKKKLLSAFKKQEISKIKYEQELNQIKVQSEQKLAQLKNDKEAMKNQVDSLALQVQQVNSELQVNKAELKEKQQEANNLQEKLQSLQSQHETQVQKLKLEGQSLAQKAKEEFDRKLASEKLNSKLRAEKEAEFRKQSAQKEQELAGKINKLNSEYLQTSRELKKAQEVLDAKKNLAAKIEQKFKSAGIKAEVSPHGDVVLDFGDHYFDTDRSKLKPEMQTILKKALPAYAQSLFDDEKIANKISSVEIIGFASPTFNGKVVDPKSLDEKSRQAVNYNLDLSYQRAKSIFQYAFDTNKMTFEHQKRLLPLIKVTGRSFLADAEEFRNPASKPDEKDFCKRYNCKKAQRVLVKFYLKE